MWTRARGSQGTGDRNASVPLYGRYEGMGLPRPLFVAAAVLFTLSVVGTLVALGIYHWYGMDLWNVFEAGVVFGIATLLLGGFAVSSELLYVHHRRQESYMSFEAMFFLGCLFMSLLNLLWIAPVLFFQ